MYASTPSASRDTLMKAIRFERPEHIPMTFHINHACYNAYPPDALFDLMESHPFLFPGFVRPKEFKLELDANARSAEPYTDDFGCTWVTATDGIVGVVHKHPLEDWSAYADFHMPDPDVSDGLGPRDWDAFARECLEKRSRGEMVYGDLRHGHTFLQLIDLRGYENLLCDMMDEEPLLDELIERLTRFNRAIIRRFVDLGVDIVRIPEDLGMQIGPMLSADNFRRYIKPAYEALMKPVRDAGILLHMHSDGDIRLLADDIVSGGVNAINLQDLVNGVDWIAAKFKGKTCVDLDIDRQSVTPYGSPSDIDRLIRGEVEALGSREGGLMMVYGLYPGVPLENAKAVMDAMERYAFFFG